MHIFYIWYLKKTLLIFYFDNVYKNLYRNVCMKRSNPVLFLPILKIVGALFSQSGYPIFATPVNPYKMVPYVDKMCWRCWCTWLFFPDIMLSTKLFFFLSGGKKWWRKKICYNIVGNFVDIYWRTICWETCWLYTILTFCCDMFWYLYIHNFVIKCITMLGTKIATKHVIMNEYQHVSQQYNNIMFSFFVYIYIFYWDHIQNHHHWQNSDKKKRRKKKHRHRHFNH